MTNKEQLDNKLDRTESIQKESPIQQRDEAMKIFEQFQKNRNFGMKIDITNIANALKADHVTTKFPEVYFVEHFLPMFAMMKPQTQDVNYNTWLDIAGGDRYPVDIVNEEGTVLFTVPPMMDDSVIDEVKAGGESMTRIERHYSRLKEIDAVGSQTYLSAKLQGIHIKEKPTQQSIDNIKAWNAIYRRYGMEDQIIQLGNILDHDSKKADQASTGHSTSGNNDIGDYELDTD